MDCGTGGAAPHSDEEEKVKLRLQGHTRGALSGMELKRGSSHIQGVVTRFPTGVFTSALACYYRREEEGHAKDGDRHSVQVQGEMLSPSLRELWLGGACGAGTLFGLFYFNLIIWK